VLFRVHADDYPEGNRRVCATSPQARFAEYAAATTRIIALFELLP
jgi:hypothetical protein